MNHLEDGIDSKVDKVEKTDKWQLYGIGDKNYDLPNNGKTINAESNAIPYTVINRNYDGRAKINNPIDNLDIANKQYVDDCVQNMPTDIHRHQLSINDIGATFVIYSSNNLKCNNPQDLTTITKATNNYFCSGIVLQSDDFLYQSVILLYQNNV